MPNWMQAAIVVQTTLFTFLACLWLTAMALRGLFHMMPVNRREAVRVASAQRAAQLGSGRFSTGVPQAR